MRTLLGICLLACVSIAVHADGMETSASALFADGLTLFDAGAFEDAIAAFEEAVAQESQQAEYVYWLGKAYGRHAEKSGWFGAVKFARKTREAFERAVELDPSYVPAVEDLIEFHRSAPRIVGASRDKAAELERHLYTITEYASEQPLDPGPLDY